MIFERPVVEEPPVEVYDALVWRDRWPRPADMPEVAPGVRGVVTEWDGAVIVGAISAVTPRNGDVGHYLDSLPTDRPVLFPNVINDRLAEMLERRGFAHHRSLFRSSPYGEWVDGWVRR